MSALALSLGSIAPAAAQDDVDVTAESAPPLPTTALTFGSMGLGGSVALTGQRGTAVATLPVPPGTTPTALRGSLDVPAGIDRGWLDVTSGNRIIGRVDLSSGAPNVPVNVPLTGLEVVDDTVTLQMTTSVIPAAGYCLDSRDASTVRLQDPVMDVTGVPAVPTVVADFLPPVLSTLTVYAPDQPTADQSTAVLTLATSVVDFYGSEPVRVVVRPTRDLSTAAPDGPFDRSVVLQSNSDGDAQLIFTDAPGAPPQLYVSGEGSVLTDQIALLTSDISALAVSTRVSAGAAPAVPTLTAETMTLSDMMLGPLTASGSGEVTVTVPLDQTRLGRAASDMRVHVLGDYTPISSGMAGALRISIGDTDLTTWPADASGAIDRWVDVPADLVERVTSLDVSMQTSGNGDTCSSGGSLSLTVNDETAVESAGGTPDGVGFASVPQGLMPGVDVAFTDDSFENTVRATTLLTGLQRLSARVLLPAVVPFEEVLNGADPAIVVAPNGFDDAGADAPLDLPLATTGTSILTLQDEGGSDDGVQVTVDSGVPFASVQVTRQNDRTLLVATASDATQLDGLVSWLGEDPTRWDGLTGNVLFGAGAREPVSLSSASDEVTAKPVAGGSTAPSGVMSILVAGGIAVAIGVLAAVLVWIRSRGKQDVRPGDSGDRDSDPDAS